MSYICTANDLLEWKDFPKGLRVLLLLNEDKKSSFEIQTKLQDMDYIVSAFFSEHEAISAISSQSESFHVAIVEVRIQNKDERCKFLETVKHLPTIMTSEEHCLSTMMKCIALGAVEFLIKPISEDKLRNLWQHVVHKAFNAGENTTSKPLKSIKEFVGSVLEIQQQNIGSHNQVPIEPEVSQTYLDSLTMISYDNESEAFDGETEFVDNTYGASVIKMEIDSPQEIVEVVEMEEDRDNGFKETDNSSTKPYVSNDNEDDVDLGVNKGNSNDVSTTRNVRGTKGNRRKVKVDWTPSLHKKFVQAVEKLGVDQAIPSRILELMKVEGLTRHNIASHLQKYRMHRRHILPKDEIRRWSHPSDSIQRNYYHHTHPVMAFPPYPNAHHLTPGQVYPMWGQQGVRFPPHSPAWGHPSYPWQPVETWHSKSYGMNADAWGCPVMPLSSPSSNFPQVQSAYGYHTSDHYWKSSTDSHLGEETIDKVVNEVISNPWLPLPIGLNPPSTDSVLSELSRQGISAVPPPFINDRYLC